MALDFGGLLAKSKPPGTTEMPPTPDVPDEADGVKERIAPIAQDLLEAVRGGDVDAIADALIASHRAIASGASDDTALSGE